MILPNAVDVEIGARQPLAGKAQLFHDAQRGFVAGHDVGFQAM